MATPPSEGVYFIVRLPEGWQLCTYRFDDYEELGVPDLWVPTLAGLLRVWLQYFEENGNGSTEKHIRSIERALPQLVAGCDTFPRGHVVRALGGRRWTITHGGGLSRGMGVSRKDIEDSFGIPGRARWLLKNDLTCTQQSIRGVCQVLPIADRWQ